MATIEPMEYEEYLMHCRGSSSTMAGLQKHMIRHMLWLARNDPNCQYTAEQGSAINKFFGLGSVSVPAKSGDVNGSAELSAQSLRGGILIKNIMLHKHGEGSTIASIGIIVKDITIKGRSIFSGQASDGVGLNVLNSFVAAGEVGINIPMDTNERIIVKLENTTAGALTVGGCAFCE